ncbi:hypothetical protein KHQ06_33385 [Nocardia tengchongensis]|uniref:Uncharacterized protein n=1 Tax=Nocardia tengchongensis TaxID=2055889 RepID=A0ABX8CLT5_9NOCA|nr:hypothetical protein [Nocardia tengchongensis]QVI20921.1 hypothetical protein KHQ06_33385 [Nocardia tengchongensis]
MPDVGEHVVGPALRLPVDKKNAGPDSEAWVQFEKHAVALELIRHVVDGVDLRAVVVQHSSDVMLIFGDRRPKLVSIKHREPHQRSGDSGWKRTQLQKPLTDLHRQWVEAGRACQPVLWSNAGFVGPARVDHRNIVEGADPSPEFVGWLATILGVDTQEATDFATDLELTAQPLPRKFEIEATGAVTVARLLTLRGRDFAGLYARECFEALTARVMELGRPYPVPPSPDSRRALVDSLLPYVDSTDAAALAARWLPVAEAESIVLGEHDRQLAATAPSPRFGWEPDARFVGRDTELACLREWLDPGGVEPVAPVAISGMTGCGKTSVATQFAAQCHPSMRPVFIPATSRAQVITALQVLSGGTARSSGPPRASPRPSPR